MDLKEKDMLVQKYEAEIQAYKRTFGMLSEEEIRSKNEMPELLSKLKVSIDALELTVRTYNGLKSEDFHILGEVVLKTESDLLKIKKFGRKSINELKEILKSMGLGLGMCLPPDVIDELETHLDDITHQINFSGA